LLKHSGIYGLGQIFGRLASFLLLPVYTHYLQPADYGCIAILDLIGNLLGILIGTGMSSAVARYHFDAHHDAERRQVWWTGLLCILLLATLVVVPAWFWRAPLAHLTLGAAVEQGRFYYALLLPTLWVSIVGDLPSAYLQVRKWSGTFVSLNLARLGLSISLNIYFLVVLRLGIVGFLLSNLIANTLSTIVSLGIFVYNQGPVSFHSPLVRRFWQFGAPLILTALLSTAMHQADRYVLRLFVDMEQVGLYSLAYTIGQAINTLCLMPFAAIWSVLVYEIAARPDAREIYVRIFRYFVYGIALIMLGSSLFARPLLSIIVDAQYLQAADVIPLVCLAYLFFSLHEHFKVPVILAKRTALLPPVFAVATATNIGANLLLIPWLGMTGAALASVVSFATFSFVALWRYRAIDRYAYPLRHCGRVVAGMVLSYIGWRSFAAAQLTPPWSVSLALLLWLSWALGLFGPLLREQVRRRQACVEPPADYTRMPAAPTSSPYLLVSEEVAQNTK
jgi:O-antigen/teichoic acid export membrane protein